MSPFSNWSLCLTLVVERLAVTSFYADSFDRRRVRRSARTQLDRLDERAVWFYEAVAVSKGMLAQTPGVGQRYIASYKDRDGHWLRHEKGHVRADG